MATAEMQRNKLLQAETLICEVLKIEGFDSYDIRHREFGGNHMGDVLGDALDCIWEARISAEKKGGIICH